MSEDRLLKLSDVAALLDVSPRTVRYWVAKGVLPVVRCPGGRPRVWASALATVQPVEAPPAVVPKPAPVVSRVAEVRSRSAEAGVVQSEVLRLRARVTDLDVALRRQRAWTTAAERRAAAAEQALDVMRKRAWR